MRALAIAGHVRACLQRRPREASALHERALSLNPNLAMAWALSAATHAYLGETDEAERRNNRYKHLSPLGPHAFLFDGFSILIHLLKRDHESAVAMGRAVSGMNPEVFGQFLTLPGSAGPSRLHPGSGGGAPAAADARALLHRGAVPGGHGDRTRERSRPLCRGLAAGGGFRGRLAVAMATRPVLDVGQTRACLLAHSGARSCPKTARGEVTSTRRCRLDKARRRARPRVECWQKPARAAYRI